MAEDNIVDINDYRMEEGTKLTVDAGEINPANKITFSDENGGECGHLIMVDGRLTFEGNADASAMVFFDYLMNLWNVDKK